MLIPSLLLFLLGLVLGAFGTMIGAGGGFLLVPVLLLLGWPHEQAVGTSLLMVTANAASGSLSYLRQRLVDLKSGWRLALSTLPGAVCGSLVVSRISGGLFHLFFGVLLLLLSVYLLLRSRRKEPAVEPGAPARPAGWRGWGFVVRDLVDHRGQRFVYGYAQPYALLLSFFVGFLSSLLGIGGGIIHVPALISLFSFPAHVATATSHFVLFFSAACGTVSDLALHHVRVGAGVALALGALVGAQIGGALSHRVKGVFIIRALAVALFLVGVRVLWPVLYKAGQ